MAIDSRRGSSNLYAIFLENQSRDRQSCGRHRSLKNHRDQGSKFELLLAVANCSRKDMGILTALFIPKLPYKEISMGPGGMNYCAWTSFASKIYKSMLPGRNEHSYYASIT